MPLLSNAHPLIRLKNGRLRDENGIAAETDLASSRFVISLWTHKIQLSPRLDRRIAALASDRDQLSRVQNDLKKE
jgi:hypothetical protein